MKNESPALFVHIAITCLIGALVALISYGIFFKKVDTSKRELEENKSIVANQIKDLKNQLEQVGINKANVDKIAKEKEEILNKAKGDLDLAKRKAAELYTNYKIAEAKATDMKKDFDKSIADLKDKYGPKIIRNEGPPISYDPGPKPSLIDFNPTIRNSIPIPFGPQPLILIADYFYPQEKNLVETNIKARTSWDIAKKACDIFNEFEKSEVLKKARVLYEDAEKLVSDTQNFATETHKTLLNAQKEIESATKYMEDTKDKILNEEGKLNTLLASLSKTKNWREFVIDSFKYLEVPNLLFSLSLFIVSLTRTFVVLGWFGKCSV